ncbi:uncharacterized protein LOC130989101 [Salvia miltiorrhiza]|uniref:uncharacterized protein LOC130989101 n=1 Tax=Salvia miltiorrhiza TaxID=226208 RepID=UPI0025AB9270|nr:uncharacterized protein LOC130989101 [Salvia miltiorrhiza]
MVPTIDNVVAWTEHITIALYGSVPSMLRNMFVDFMEKNGHSKRVQKLKKASIDMLDLPWVDPENDTDCGIYVMRHMETFKGEYSGKWITGMKRNSKQQMRYMRVKYCAAIVGASSNLLKDNILSEAEKYCRLTNELGPINMEKILLRKLSLKT